MPDILIHRSIIHLQILNANAMIYEHLRIPTEMVLSNSADVIIKCRDRSGNFGNNYYSVFIYMLRLICIV